MYLTLWDYNRTKIQMTYISNFVQAVGTMDVNCLGPALLALTVIGTTVTRSSVKLLHDL